MTWPMTWYTGNPTYDSVVTAALILAALVALVGPFIQSPYGRFANERFGLSLDPRLGWFLMELPASLSFAWFYLHGPHRLETTPLVLAGVWCVHYANRGFFFPFSIRSPRGAKASFSAFIIVFGWMVTSLHGYLHAAYFSTYGTQYTVEWLRDPRFVFGISLYAISLALNIHSDAIVRNLRTKKEVEEGTRIYRLPRGGLFQWVSSPAYLTELLAWTGFAIATWSLAGVFILAISAANLVPRAFATHKWYRERFADYPAERKALIPFLL